MRPGPNFLSLVRLLNGFGLACARRNGVTSRRLGGYPSLSLPCPGGADELRCLWRSMIPMPNEFDGPRSAPARARSPQDAACSGVPANSERARYATVVRELFFLNDSSRNGNASIRTYSAITRLSHSFNVFLISMLSYLL